jgi:leucyl aminopeptidase
MKFQAITTKFTEANAPVLAAIVFKGENTKSGDLKALDSVTSGALSLVLGTKEFRGESGETAFIHFKPKGKVKASRLLVIGGGNKKDFKSSSISVAAGTAARAIAKKGHTNFAFNPRVIADAAELAAGFAQGVTSSQFELDKYKSKDKNTRYVKGASLFIEGSNPADVKSGLEKGLILGESMNFARELANEPPNVLTPTEMAKRAKDMATEYGLKCEILDEAKMEKLGMGSLLSVTKGSDQPAKMIVLKYTPEVSTGSAGELLSFVGKGITFDTGGISLKPGNGMEAMKYDMSGGATVLGTMMAIARLKPTIPILGVVAAVENMPDGKASRPSDVVTAMNGKTIEILNTDAEGRLILADAVAYAETLGATTIVDMATLTGAVIVALGDVNTGIMGTDQELVDSIIECGKDVGEGFWQLPLGPDYSRGIKSDIADIKNMGIPGKAGTIAGAAFIQEFVDKAKWAHLDIAGTAWADGERAHQSKGPTGVAVRTLVRLVEKSS